jgi:outer membrane protein assembly factor BamB
MKKQLACAAWVLSVICGYGDDWSSWRGPHANGISNETGWSLAGAKTSWTKELGNGYSSVSVKGDRVYAMGHVPGIEPLGQDTVYCFESKTGTVIWSYAYAGTTGKYKGPRATPVLDGEFLYVVSRDGVAICLDATTGKLRWTTDVLKKTNNKNLKWGISSSAVIDGNLLLLNIGEAGVALNKKSGVVVWKSNGVCSYASPVVFDHKGTRLAAFFAGDGLQIVHADTGKKADFLEWETKYQTNGADPLVIGDQIFISSGYGHGCAWLDFSTGKLKKVWENDLLKSHFSGCVYLDGYIYGIDGQTNGKGSLRCLSAKDGSEQWSERIGFGSLMVADGKLIVLDANGMLHLAEASPKKYTEVSQFDTGLEKLCWTAPVLANGMIYCRNDKGTLVAIDVSK